MRQSNSKGVDLGPAQERVIQAARAMTEAAEWDGTWTAEYFELRNAVRDLKALEDSIGGHQQ